VREVARTLLAHGISAMPVLDADGVPIGMVSEGALVSRDELERIERRDWWLKLVADDTAPDSGFLAKLRAPDRTAGDVMSAPVITVSEDTELTEVARLLAQQHIKRVPVVTKGRVVGIVSRADLLGALASPGPDAAARPPAPRKRGFLLGLFGDYHRPAWQVVPTHEDATPPSASAGLDAAAFRTLVEDFQTGAAQHHDETRRAEAEQRQLLAKQLIDTHVSDEVWRGLLHQARQSAEAGGKECLLLRFPNELCTDGGRAIDVAQEGWPATLRGEAAELYLRWERELKSRGFRLAARVLEYPAGMPGDIGLFLVWGEAA
jgi:CBS domain-containing protein